MMQEVFEKLRDLQEVLAKMFEVEAEIAEIPHALETKQELLTRTNKAYLELHEKSEKAKDDLKSLRIQLDDAERSRENSEKQMELITTQREFEALEKEIKDAAAREQQLRKSLLAKEKYCGELDEKLEEQEALMAYQQEEVKAETEKKDARISEKEQELSSLQSQRDALTPGLSDELIFKFERIIKNKAGKGIVPIHGLVCQGCHMTLPIQFVNDVRKAEDIEFCPYCSRILYFDETFEGAEAQFVKHDDVEIEEGGLADFVDKDEFDDFV